MIQINVHYVSHSNQQPTDYSQSCFCNRSSKSSKISSRKGSTDIDSKTKFKTEVIRLSIRYASIGQIKLIVPTAKMYLFINQV